MPEPTPEPHSITVHLDKLLDARGMTLTELADRVGVTIVNLSILKNGRAKAIRFSTLTALCREDWVEEAVGVTKDRVIRELLVDSWVASFATQDRVRVIFDEEMASAHDEQRARELRRTAAYPRVPVIVLSATTGVPPELRTEMTRLQREIATAAGGQHVEVPAAGHYIYRSQPQAVIDAIARVVDQVRAETRSAETG